MLARVCYILGVFVVGVRGPVPKDPESRKRRNKPTLDQQLDSVANAPVSMPVVLREDVERWKNRESNPHWHDAAREMWDGLRLSRQSVFYEPSDWALAWSLCEDLSEYKWSERRNGQILTALMSGFSSLLVSAGDRRRLQVELTGGEDADSGLTPGEAEVLKWETMLAKIGTASG